MAWNISGNTNYANIHKNSGILTYGTELCGGVPSGCTPSVDYSVSCYLEKDSVNFPKYIDGFYDGNIVRINYNGKSCNQDMFVMWFNYPDDNYHYSSILDKVKTDIDENPKPLFDIKNVDDCEHVVISSDGSFRTGSQKFEDSSYIDSGYPKIASNPCDSSDTSVKYVNGRTYQGHKIKYHTISDRIPKDFYTNHTELVELYFPHMYVDNSNEGKNIKEIGENAFKGCDRLSAVTFGAVEKIEKYAFENCSNLESIDWGHMDCSGSRIKNIYEGAFKGCKSIKKLCLEKLESVEEIKEHAFEGCSGVTYFTLPTSSAYTTITKHCFDGLKSCPSFTIPSNIERIEEGAFAKWTGSGDIVGLTIPSTVTYIGSSAFSNSNVAYYLRWLDLSRVTIEEDAFSSFNSGEAPYAMFCPSGTLQAYKNYFNERGMTSYANKITEIN